MSAVWYRFRAELRGRWKSIAALALLVGVAGGATIAAVAGARRTDTAYSRLVRATDASEVLVNPDQGSESALSSDDVARLPMVSSAGRVDGIVLGPADLRDFNDFGRFGIVLAPDAAAARKLGRPKILEGRMPDPRRASEVLIDPVLARQESLGVGSKIRAFTLSDADLAASDSLDPDAAVAAIRSGETGRRVLLTVTGIGVTPDSIVVDEGFEIPQMLLSPAFSERFPDTAVQYWGEIVRLRRGATDVPAFRKAVAALVPDEAVAFQTNSVTAAKVDRAVQPSVGALTVFAIVIALTGLLVVGQALARQSFLDSVDYPALNALGFARHQRFESAMLRAALVAVLGGLLALVLAVALSPLTPIGVARTAEPDPGLRVDALVLGIGVVAVVLLMLALAALPAWRYARTRALQQRDADVTRPSRIAHSLGAAGASMPLTAGVRMALEPGRGRTAVPVRTTIVSALLAVATVTGAVVFAASLDHLVSTPRLFGWNWDVRIDAGADSPDQASVSSQQLATLLGSSHEVKAWSTVTQSNVTLDGVSMPAIGIDPEHREVQPSLVSGRVPERDTEIALGARTMRSLGVGIGDTVDARLEEGGSTGLRVVGRVVLPGFGTYQGSDKTTLGEGAVVTQTTLGRLGPDFYRRAFLVDFRDDPASAPAQQVKNDALAIIADANGSPTGLEVAVQRPSDIVAYEKVRTTPIVLALVLALLAMATVAHALVTGVRRRRRDLALLKTLGFTRGQVSGAIAWQASTIGVVALVIGLPLGVVLGRWAWSALADNLGTVSEPIVPIALLLVAIPVVIVLLNLVAYVPGRIAARLRPATVLRSE